MVQTNRVIIIQGSSNSNGQTRMLSDFLISKGGIAHLDLATKKINHFDYNFENVNDDFIPIMEDIIDNYDTFIFASPVYWYTMSGIMKVFFDRLSDLLKTHKNLGSSLRGKSMAVLSSGSDSELKPGFHMPFIESANYLGLNYIGDVHGWIEGENIPDVVRSKLEAFYEVISSTNH